MVFASLIALVFLNNLDFMLTPVVQQIAYINGHNVVFKNDIDRID